MASVDNGLWAPETRVAKTGKEAKIESWWEVRRAGPAEPAPTRGATPLVERCMRVHSFGEDFARRVLKGYRQFMELKSVMNDWQELKLAPSNPINQMWELHLLDNLNYTEDCLLLFGRVIGHNPDAILDGSAMRERIMTTQIAFQARYGDDLDQDVWDFGDEWNKDSMAQPAMIKKFDSIEVSSRGRLPVAGRIDDVSASRGRTPSIPKGPVSPRRVNPTKTPTSASPGGNEPITIFLRDQASGEETYFSLRYKSTLRIVFTVFAERRGLNQDSLKFNYNGQQLTGYETPHSLALEDRARIDVNIAR
mmetsp:Transcript_12008/g.34413  ORF Transcript_12008/g.34413 Transcript_12008/m.34413 type:complete len:307 (+) Transcript_12008:127-1047(+)|eukprot:CAMPEP_0172364716 /NCGR_PEP_ID=MMETSP1060-20121228/7773_1 /TAXON_ID=37318 /ORGANISM="Pseudo-nitzschia pungens, Strain cf. cingulata" /LENGTH=306 /DNA_ID=CAMNT_0013087785 /DNA_START=96 /DNA_END=1016 /DNA_ORIENTATION=+